MQSLWFFEDVDLFTILCPHKYGSYKQSHRLEAYKKKDYIYLEEDAAHSIYLIDKGKVKIGYYTEDGIEVVKAILSRGDIFGEKVILGEEKRDEFAQSIDNNTTICSVSEDTLRELIRNNKNFSLRIYKFLGYRFKKLERRIQLLLFKDCRTRLKEFIQELSQEYGYNCPDTGNVIVKHPYTQKDIASLIGTSRPTLNILLNELKQENYIDFDRKEIRIKNAM